MYVKIRELAFSTFDREARSRRRIRFYLPSEKISVNAGLKVDFR